jgi:deoxyribonuclease-4
MLIGAHVGSLKTAVERGVERDCDAIQIFNQSPRMWKPPAYSEDEHFAPFRAALEDTEIEAVLIHGVYLINCASEDEAIGEKSLNSLVHSLAVGDAIGAHAVVLHAGSALKGDPGEAIKRAGPLIAEALERTDGCPLHLENTAGAGGTLGRSFEELGALLEAAGGHDRLGVCLDSCHLFASGYDIRSEAGLDAMFEQLDAEVGRERLGSLHVNDSVTPLGSNRDRHAPLGDGEIGEAGCATFLSEPRFEGLPAIFEGPGIGGKQVEPEDIQIMRRLREAGLSARAATAR